MNELINQQRDQVAQLTAERDALAAQNHVLRTAAKFILDAKLPSSKRKAYAALSDAVNKAAQHHLAEARAEAIEQAATYLSESVPDKSHESVIFKDGYVYISTRYLREYAEQIRKGEAK